MSIMYRYGATALSSKPIRLFPLPSWIVDIVCPCTLCVHNHASRLKGLNPRVAVDHVVRSQRRPIYLWSV